MAESDASVPSVATMIGPVERGSESSDVPSNEPAGVVKWAGDVMVILLLRIRLRGGRAPRSMPYVVDGTGCPLLGPSWITPQCMSGTGSRLSAEQRHLSEITVHG